MIEDTDLRLAAELQITPLDAMFERLFITVDGLPKDFDAKIAAMSADPKLASAIEPNDSRMPQGPIGRALDVAWFLAYAKESGGQTAIATSCGTTVEVLASAWNRGGWEPPLA
jgi:hypothetical protein